MDDVGAGAAASYGEAILLVSELARETGSHFFADKAGFDYASSLAEWAAITHAEWFMNAHRDTKKQRDPIRLMGPVIPDEYRAVDPSTRDDIRERARRFSAIRD